MFYDQSTNKNYLNWKNTELIVGFPLHRVSCRRYLLLWSNTQKREKERKFVFPFPRNVRFCPVALRASARLKVDQRWTKNIEETLFVCALRLYNEEKPFKLKQTTQLTFVYLHILSQFQKTFFPFCIDEKCPGKNLKLPFQLLLRLKRRMILLFPSARMSWQMWSRKMKESFSSSRLRNNNEDNQGKAQKQIWQKAGKPFRDLKI